MAAGRLDVVPDVVEVQPNAVADVGSRLVEALNKVGGRLLRHMSHRLRQTCRRDRETCRRRRHISPV